MAGGSQGTRTQTAGNHRDYDITRSRRTERSRGRFCSGSRGQDIIGEQDAGTVEFDSCGNFKRAALLFAANSRWRAGLLRGGTRFPQDRRLQRAAQPLG